MGYRGSSNKPKETCRRKVSDNHQVCLFNSSDADLDREIGTMHLSAKAKDDALKKLRLEIERLQEEKEDLMNGAGSVRYTRHR
jgi:archaellum component FlaC